MRLIFKRYCTSNYCSLSIGLHVISLSIYPFVQKAIKLVDEIIAMLFREISFFLSVLARRWLFSLFRILRWKTNHRRNTENIYPPSLARDTARLVNT